MSPSNRPVLVVENDPFLRLIQVILDPSTPTERIAAFEHFMAHDEPDFAGWCARLREQVPPLYPAEVRLVDSQAELRACLPGAAIVVVEGFSVGESELAAGSGSLKIIQKYGTLTPGIDRAACERTGVRVFTIRRRANIATAEHALALLLALARKIPQSANRISIAQLQASGYSPTRFDRSLTPNGNWARIPGLKTLYGRQLGIIGLGEIGRELATRAAAFGMRVVYTQRHRADDDQRYQATYCAMEELLARSDCISLHLPGGVATRGIIGRRELEIMKPGALLVNVSQPQLVDREALIQALASGKIGGFGLDTSYEEPGQSSDPLLGFGNVMITPHLGGSPRFNALADFEELLVNLSRALKE